MSIPVIIMVVKLGTNMIVYLIVTSLTLIFIDKTCHVTCSAISTRYWLRRVWRYQWGLIRSRKSKDRQEYSQKKTDKGTNNDLQNITQNTWIEQHEAHLKPGMNSGAPEG